MADIANIGFSVDTGNLDRANEALDKMVATTGRLSPNVDSTNQSLSMQINKLLGIGRGVKSASASFDVFNNSIEKTSDDFNRLRMSIDPVYAASKKYERQLEVLNRASASGLISNKQYEATLELINQEFLGIPQSANVASQSIQRFSIVNSQASRRISAATSSSRNFSHGLQNASYQIQDIIVQLEAGIPLTRTLGQQLPQLLGGFGVYGALAGVAAVGITTLTSAIINAGNSAKDASGKFDDFKSTLEGLISIEHEYRDLQAKLSGDFLGSRIQRAREQLDLALKERAKIMEAYRKGDASRAELDKAQERVTEAVIKLRPAERIQRELNKLRTEESIRSVREEIAVRQQLLESVQAGIITFSQYEARKKAIEEANRLNVEVGSKEYEQILANITATQQLEAAEESLRKMRASSGTGSLVTGGPSEETRLFFQIEREHTEAVLKARREQEKENERYMRSLSSIMDNVYPVAAATRSYEEDVMILNRALKEGTITQEQYNEAVAYSARVLQEAKDQASGMSQLYDSLERSFDSFADTVISRNADMGDAWRSLGLDILRAAQQQLIFYATGGAASSIGGAIFNLGKILFGGFGGGVSSAAQSLTAAQTIQQFDFAASVGAAAADGGSFLVDGRFPNIRAGRDNRLVTLAARDGEVINVTTPGRRGQMYNGGVTVQNNFNIDARGAEAGVEERIRSAIAQAAPQIVSQSVASVRNERQRNPRFFS